MKKITLLLLAMVMLVCGCAEKGETIKKTQFTSSDEWSAVESSRTITAALNFLSLDGNHLMTEIREVRVDEGQTDVEAVIRALIAGPTDTRTMRRILSSSIDLVSVEKTGRVINVELSANYTYYSEIEMLRVRVALANTLCPLFDVDYVNVYVDSADPGYSGMPLGSVRQTSLDLSLYCDQVVQEQKNILDDDNYEERRIVTLYALDTDGRYLIADPKEITIDTVSSGETVERNYLRTLVFEIVTNGEGTLFDKFNLGSEPVLMTDENGKRCALVVLKEMPEDPVMSIGALTYAVTGFVCNVSYLTLGLYDEDTTEGWRPITYIDGIGTINQGKVERYMFNDIIGDYIKLYFPSQDVYSLVSVKKAVAQSKAADPTEILKTLLDTQPQNGCMSMNDMGIGSEQINSVKLCDSVAVIDMQPEFYDICAKLDRRSEFLTMYSIINTITEISGINSVQFLCDGMTVEKLNTIQLSGPLMRNIGVITD